MEVWAELVIHIDSCVNNSQDILPSEPDAETWLYINNNLPVQDNKVSY